MKNGKIKTLSLKKALALVSIMIFGTASAATIDWQGDGGNTQWHNNDNWSANNIGGNDIARWRGIYAGTDKQAICFNNQNVGRLLLTNPGKNVDIGIANGKTLTNKGLNGLGIDLSSTTKTLTIDQAGTFLQEDNQAGGNAVRWDLIGTGSGNLVIDSLFKIENGVELTMQIDSGRVVNLKKGAKASTASVIKTGNGILTLGGETLWTGDTVIGGGTLRLSADNALSSSSALTFNTGTTLESQGNSGAFSTLEINGTVVFDLGGLGTSQLSFADSSSVAWGSTLQITNYTAGDVISFAGAGLTSEQLADITINGEQAVFDGDNLVAIPEPAAVALMIFSGMGILFFRRLSI
jgi:autotransporter-associated beta strand protein